MVIYKLINHFSHHSAAFGFQASLPPDSIALIFLITRIHDILDSSVSKKIGNIACVTAYLFNSASRQYHDVWASQFLFLHIIHGTVPPTVTCLYGHISWSPVQAHYKSLLGLSQYLPFMRCAMAKPKARFMLNIQKWPISVYGGGFLALKTHLDTRNESHQGGRKSGGMYLLVPLTLRRRGTKGTAFLMFYGQHFHHHHLLLLQVGTFQKVFNQWRSLTFNRFELNMFKGQNLQLSCHPPLFY